MAVEVASTAPSMQGTGLSRIYYDSMILSLGRETSFLPEILNDEWNSEALNCNQVVQFMTEAQVGEWRDYEDNQKLVSDQATVAFVTLTIRRAAYKAISTTLLDEATFCDRFESYIDSFTRSMWESLEARYRSYVFSMMLCEAQWQGSNTGKYQNIDLGTLANPLVRTPKNISSVFTSARRVFSEALRWSDEPGTMFAIINPAIEEAIRNSPSFIKANELGNNEPSSLITGKIPGTISGFQVFTTNELPVSSSGATPIIFGWKQATIFYYNIVNSRIKEPTDSFSKEYQALTIYDGKVLYPDALAVAMVNITNSEN